jgi:hypothetical protein
MRNRDFLFLLIGATFFFSVISYILQLPSNALLNKFVNYDSLSYWNAAKLIFSEGGKPDPIRPFFYPFLIGLSSLFSDSTSFGLQWAIGLNLILWLSTVAIVFKILDESTNRKIALTGAIIFILHTSNIVMVWSVLSETLFHFLLVGSIYFLLKYLRNTEKTGSFLSFVTFFCLFILTRPTFYPFIFFLIPLFFWSVYRRYLSLFVAAISIFIAISTVGFNVYKVKESYGNWTLSYIGHCALYSFFGAYAKVVSPEKSLNKIGEDWLKEREQRDNNIARYVDSISWSALPALVNSDLGEQIKNNKRGLIFTFVRDLFSNSTASNFLILSLENVKKRSFFEAAKNSILWFSRLQNILNSILALWMSFTFLRYRSCLREKNQAIYYILGVNCISNLFAVLISAISFTQGDRFHLVVIPLNIITLGVFYFYKFDCKICNRDS